MLKIQYCVIQNMVVIEPIKVEYWYNDKSNLV